MMLEQYAYLAEIVGVILIIASLIYVALQLKQGTAAIRAAARQAAVSTDMTILESAIAFPEIYESRFKEEITREQSARLENWLIQLIRSREHHWLQYEEGMLDERAWQAYLSGLSVNLCFPRTRAWWDSIARNWFDPRFVSEVDRLLAGVPVETEFRTNMEKIDDMMKTSTPQL